MSLVKSPLGICLGKIPLNTLPPLKPFVSYIINENICFVDFFLGGFRKDINLYQPSEKLGIIGLAVFSYINYTHANRYDNQIICIRFLHVNQEIRIKEMEIAQHNYSTINNKQIYSPRLYKYQESSVLYSPTVQLFGSLSQTHTISVQTHTQVSAPWCKQKNYYLRSIMYLKTYKKCGLCKVFFYT